MKAMEWEASGFSSEFFKNPSCGTTRRLEDVMTPVFTNASAKATTTRRVLVTDAEVEARVGQLIEDKVAPLNTFISFAQFLKDAEEELKDVWEKTAEPVVSVVADVVDTVRFVLLYGMDAWSRDRGWHEVWSLYRIGDALVIVLTRTQ